MKKYAIQLVAISMVVLSPFALGQIPNADPSNQSNAGANNEPAAEITITSDALNAIQESVEAIATNTTPDRTAQQNQENRDQLAIELAIRDLGAQEQMAKFTKLIYLVTASSIVVGVITIICLGISIAQTKIIIRQDRAWVLASSEDKSTSATNMAGSLVSYTRHIKVVNCGKSPAMNFRYTLAEFNRYPTKIDIQSVVSCLGMANFHILGPGEWVTAFLKRTASEIADISRGEVLVIYICAEYETVYEERYFMEVCYEVRFTITPDEIGRGVVSDLLNPFDEFNSIRRIG